MLTRLPCGRENSASFTAILQVRLERGDKGPIRHALRAKQLLGEAWADAVKCLYGLHTDDGAPGEAHAEYEDDTCSSDSESGRDDDADDEYDGSDTALVYGASGACCASDGARPPPSPPRRPERWWRLSPSLDHAPLPEEFRWVLAMPHMANTLDHDVHHIHAACPR